MNKSIKKILFLTIILINIFFFNTYKVNAKVTECYYVLPNSNIKSSNGQKVRIVQDSKLKKSDDIKRMYYSIKLTEDYIETYNDWTLKDNYNKGNTTFKFSSGCPKYISVFADPSTKQATIDTYSNGSDDKFIDYVKNYYNADTNEHGSWFRLSDTVNGMPISVKYIPLYYYKTEAGGDKKCYLDKNLFTKQASYCEIEYSGMNPIKQYIDSTTLAYSNLSTKIKSSFISECDLKNKSEEEKNKIYGEVKSYIDNLKNGIDDSKGSSGCIGQEKKIAALSRAIYLYDWILEGNSDSTINGFSRYNSYLKNTRNNNWASIGSDERSGTFTDWLSLGDLPNESGEDFNKTLDSYFSLGENQSKANDLKNTELHICDYSSSDSNQCYNAMNACRNGDSPTSENIRTCYINTRNGAAEAQSGNCDSLLAKCMEESQGITDATNALAKLNQERATLNTLITSQENILANAKTSINLTPNQSNPLSMLNGSIDSSVNFECSDISFLRFIWLIMIIAAPILTIVFGVLDFTQAIMAGDEQKMNKLKSKFIKRLAALALFIILPIIIKTIVNISDNDSVRSIKMAKCIVNGED